MACTTENLAALRKQVADRIGSRIEALDRDHYPESLLGLLRDALLDVRCPRAVALLHASIAGKAVELTDELVAAEVLCRGMIFGAVLADSGPPSGGLAGRLAEDHDMAHLLLTADTLLTWPFELVSSAAGGAALTGKFAGSLRRSLGRLERENQGLDGLIAWRPLIGLVECIAGSRATGERPAGFDDVARLAYLRELEHWIGRPRHLADALERAASRAEKAAIDSSLRAAVDLLNA